jgi:hypothetical protein
MREKTERWKALCEQAAVEQDPEKLLQLVREISRLLEEKQARLSGLRPTEPQPEDQNLIPTNGRK